MIVRCVVIAAACLWLLPACSSSKTAAHVRENTIMLEQLYQTHEATPAAAAGVPLPAPSSCVTVTLAAVVHAALSNNPLVTIAEHQLDMARADAWRAMSYYFPRGKLGGAYTYYSEQTINDVQFDISQAAQPVNEMIKGYNAAIDKLRVLFPDLQSIKGQVPETITTDVRIEPHSEVRGALRIMQPLFVGGQIYFRHKQARTGEVLADVRLMQARQNVAHDALLTYFLWNHLGNLRQVLTEARARVTAIERLADRRREHADPADRDDAKVATEYWRARAFRLVLAERITRTEDAMRSAEFALRALTGQPAWMPLAPAAFDFASLSNSTVFIAATARRRPTNNLDIRQLDLMVRAAKQGRMATQGALWPQVYGFFQYDTVDVVDYQAGDEGSWFIGIGLELPVFDLLENIAKLRRANAEVRAMRAALAAGLLKTEAEIQALSGQLTAVQERRLLLDEARAAIANRISTARDLRMLGYDSIREMLDAQYEKLQVDVQHADVVHEQAVTTLNVAEFFPDAFTTYVDTLTP